MKDYSDEIRNDQIEEDFEDSLSEMERLERSRTCKHTLDGESTLEIIKGRSSPQDPLETRDSFFCHVCGFAGVKEFTSEDR